MTLMTDVRLNFVTTRDFATTYIGQTKNLVARFEAHNKGKVAGGANATDDQSVRPWALLGYVTGFSEIDSTESQSSTRQTFETLWQYIRDKKQYEKQRNANDCMAYAGKAIIKWVLTHEGVGSRSGFALRITEPSSSRKKTRRSVSLQDKTTMIMAESAL